MIFVHNPGRGSRFLNTLALLGVAAVIYFTLVWQALFQLPGCPLCGLQRGALVLAGMGLLLNVRLGPSPLHYAMVIGAALAGVAVTVLQIAPQAAAGDADVMLGLRLSSWALLAFLGLVLFSLLMLALDRKWGDNALRRPVALAGAVVMALFLIAALASAIGAALDCGFEACPGTPIVYRPA